jgi:hypothetical protein
LYKTWTPAAERALLGIVGRAPAMLVVEHSGEVGEALAAAWWAQLPSWSCD